MELKPAPCCTLHVKRLGQPSEFVRRMFGGPAISAAAFVQQRARLAEALKDTCGHYKTAASMQHSYLLNDDRDNRVYNYTALLADFTGLSVEDIEDLGGNSYPD